MFSEKRCKIRKKENIWFESLREFLKNAHSAEKLAKSNDFDEIKSVTEKIGSNYILSDQKLLFDFKKPFDLIPKYISTTARRNATQKIPTSKICRLKTTPAFAGQAKIAD